MYPSHSSSADSDSNCSAGRARRSRSRSFCVFTPTSDVPTSDVPTSDVTFCFCGTQPLSADLEHRPIALRGQGGAVAGLWLPLGIGEASLCLPSWLSYPAMQHDKWFRKALLYLSCTGTAVMCTVLLPADTHLLLPLVPGLYRARICMKS